MRITARSITSTFLCTFARATCQDHTSPWIHAYICARLLSITDKLPYIDGTIVRVLVVNGESGAMAGISPDTRDGRNIPRVKALTIINDNHKICVLTCATRSAGDEEGVLEWSQRSELHIIGCILGRSGERGRKIEVHCGSVTAILSSAIDSATSVFIAWLGSE